MTRRLAACLPFCLTAVLTAQAPVVEKVDPPNW
jgi:hypothetical protein